MKTIELSKASRSLAEYVKKLDGDVFVLTEKDKAVAAIVPLTNVDTESLALSAHPEFLKLIARSRREFDAGKTVSLDKMKRAVLVRGASKRGMRTKACRRRARRTQSQPQ
jgi:antitoxin (DNA-binding transcriptional repressor) of toxin-antitoxin stability system